MKNISLWLLLGFLCTFCQTKKQESKPELQYTQNIEDWYTRKSGITQYLIEIAEGDPKVAIEHANQQTR